MGTSTCSSTKKFSWFALSFDYLFYWGENVSYGLKSLGCRCATSDGDIVGMNVDDS